MKTATPLAEAVSRFGAPLRRKLSGKGAMGAPEDQLRAPLEVLLADLSELLLFKPGEVVPVGETTLSSLKTRPDYAVTVNNALVGFVEVKAPGKGADPRKFRDDTTRRNGTSSNPCRTSSTPTATPSASGGTANSRTRSFAWRATSRQPERSSRPRRLLHVFSRISCAGSPSRRPVPGTGRGERTPLPAAPRRSDRTAGARQPGTDRPGGGLAEAALSRSDRRSSSPTAMRRPSRSAC